MSLLQKIRDFLNKKKEVTIDTSGKPMVAIDFDGVIHSYTSGWQGATNIPDLPVSRYISRSRRRYTSIDWLTEMIRSGKVTVAIYSTRNAQKGGIGAMRQWLTDNGMERNILNKIKFPDKKPPAFITIDDRAITFKGKFQSVDELLKFRPWYK